MNGFASGFVSAGQMGFGRNCADACFEETDGTGYSGLEAVQDGLTITVTRRLLFVHVAD